MKILNRSQRRAKRKRIREKRKLLGFAQKIDVKPDWTTMRPEILKKSDGCYLCGRPLTLETMTTDHCTIEPMGAKKNDSPDNLMPCCAPCNNRKGSRRIRWGVECACGQMILITGLPCLRCERLGTSVKRHSEHVI